MDWIVSYPIFTLDVSHGHFDMTKMSTSTLVVARTPCAMAASSSASIMACERRMWGAMKTCTIAKRCNTYRFFQTHTRYACGYAQCVERALQECQLMCHAEHCFSCRVQVDADTTQSL